MSSPFEVPIFYLTSNYTGIAALVIVLYDWIINIPREVGTFWSGDARTLSTALYFANRSVSLSMAALEAMGLGSWSDEVCTRGTLASVALGCVSYIPLAVFSALRAYALSRRRVLSLIIFILFAVPSITDAIRLKYLSSHVLFPSIGCSAVDNTPGELTLMAAIKDVFFITNRACAFLAVLADALLLAITWRVLAPSGQRGVSLKSKGLVYIMLRDGAIYFILIMVLNATDLIFITYAMIRAERGITDSDTNAMAAIETLRTFLPPMLVSRFLLDLQEAHQRKVVLLGTSSLLDSPSSPSSWVGFGSPSRAAHTHTHTNNGSIAFAPAASLGALGASIDTEDWRDTETEDQDEEVGAGVVLAVAFPVPRGDGDGVHLRLGDVEGASPPPSPPWTEYKALLEGRRVG
ncbi:hypothetical protein V8D89_002603 [Ganoderma adspersum]